MLEEIFILLKFLLCLFGCLAFLGVFVCCLIYIDTSTLDVIRYCPNCGIDLLNRI